MALVGDFEESLRSLPPGYRELGPADPNEPVTVTLYLRRRPSEGLITSLPSFGAIPPPDRRYLARELFPDLWGASAEDVEAVRTEAAKFGIKIVGENIARRSMQLSGTVGTLGPMFGVKLSYYSGALGRIRGRAGPLRLTPGLEDRVIGVFGLDQRPQLRAHFRIAKSSEISYSPLQVATAYGFPGGTTGAGQTIALLEFGGGFRTEDIQSYFQSIGLPVPSVTVVSVDGATNAPTGNPNGPDAEVELDIEMAGAIAPGAAIVVYFAPNSEQGFLDALTTAIHDSANHPNLISISWGGPEATWTAQATTTFSQACEDATSLGITVTAAAGDQGASDGETGGALAVDFPASSPYVLGCGGTRLELDTEDADEIRSEVVWNDLSEGEGATGGGVSQLFPLPAYQIAAGVPSGEGGYKGRGVPDVAGDADPQTGYSMFIDGSSTVIGGTSAVAPMWAALIARINQALGAPVGFLQPLIYVAPESTTFREITEGNNDGFDAEPGWNACTGLGSPDGTELLGALEKK